MDKKLEKYLLEVDRYLRYMPISEKADILGELKSGFLDMTADGKTPEEILAKMGPSKELAAGYFGDAIKREKKLSLKKIWLTIGFYSVASLAWLTVIPTLASLAVAFLFSSVVSVIAGILGCIKPFVDFALANDMHFVVFDYEPVGIPALLIGLALAVVFFLLGVFFWKVTVAAIRKLGEGRHKLQYMD